MSLFTQEFKWIPVKCQGNSTKSGGGGGGEGGRRVICIPFRVSSSTLSHFMPSNPGLGTARQDNIKTITYSAVAKCNSQQTLPLSFTIVNFFSPCRVNLL